MAIASTVGVGRFLFLIFRLDFEMPAAIRLDCHLLSIGRCILKDMLEKLIENKCVPCRGFTTQRAGPCRCLLLQSQEDGGIKTFIMFTCHRSTWCLDSSHLDRIFESHVCCQGHDIIVFCSVLHWSQLDRRPLNLKGALTISNDSLSTQVFAAFQLFDQSTNRTFLNQIDKKEVLL